MKKVLSLLLAAVLALGVCACGDDNSLDSSQQSSTTNTTSSVDENNTTQTSSKDISNEESVDTEVKITVPLLDKDLKTMKRVKILPLGDSFTATAPMAYRWYLHTMLYQNGNFFEFVGSKQSADPRLGSNYERHEGTGGHKSTNGLEVYNTKIAGGKIKYDVMVLFYGINDVREEGQVKEFEKNYTALLDAIFTDRPDAIIYAIGAPKEYTAKATESIVNSFKSKGYDITYVNMYQREDVKFDSKEDYLTITVEKGHPNSNGYKKFAGVLFDAMKDKITELNKQTENNTKVPMAVNQVILDTTSLNLTIGEEHEMVAQIIPEFADVQTVLWQSSNPKVCEVDEYGMVKAVGAGSSSIVGYSLDGKASATCKVTVKNEKFAFVGDYKEKVFKDGFETGEYWDANAQEYIVTPATKNMSFGWGATSDLTLSTTSVYNAGANFDFSFYAAVNANIGNKTDERYVALSFGDYKLAVGNCASQVILYYKNKEVGRKTFNVHAYDLMQYRIVTKDGTAYVYRNQELLFEAKTGTSENSGTVTVEWRTKSGVGVVDGILIKK